MSGIKRAEPFIEWLNGLLKEEFKNEKFYKAAWNEAVEKDANGASFELESRFAIDNRPYSYSIS